MHQDTPTLVAIDVKDTDDDHSTAPASETDPVLVRRTYVSTAPDTTLDQTELIKTGPLLQSRAEKGS